MCTDYTADKLGWVLSFIKGSEYPVNTEHKVILIL